MRLLDNVEKATKVDCELKGYSQEGVRIEDIRDGTLTSQRFQRLKEGRRNQEHTLALEMNKKHAARSIPCNVACVSLNLIPSR